MGLLDEVRDFLAGAGLGLTSGVNLWTAMQPDVPDVIVALYEYAGGSPTDTFAVPGVYETQGLQVITRSDIAQTPGSYTAARTLARGAFAALEAVTNQTLSGTRYLRIKPVQSPFSLGRDESQRWRFVFNAMCYKAPS